MHIAQIVIKADDQYHFTCIEPFVVQIDLNRYPINSLDFDFDEGGDNQGYVFDHVTGQLHIDGFDITDYRGFGRTVFIGFDDRSNQYELSVYFIECCDDNPSFNSFMAEPYPLSFWESSGVIDADYVLVMGEVELDIPLNVQSSILEMGIDARLVAQTDISVSSEDSEFLPYCRYYWDGIHLHDPTNSLSFESSVMKGALRGIYMRDNVVAEVTSSFFEDNLRAFCLFEFTDNGPFETNSFLKFDGNDFHVTITDLSCLTNFALTCEQHPSSPIDMRDYTLPTLISQPERTMMIYANNAYFRVGSENLNQNNFEDKAFEEHVHIGAIESTIIIQNNYFEEAEGVRTENSRIVVGGDQPSSANLFRHSDIFTVGSAAYIKNNEFENVSPEKIDRENSVVVNDAIHNSFPGFTPGFLLENNSFLNYTEIRVRNDLASVSNYRIVDNSITTNLDFVLEMNFTNAQSNANGRLYVANNNHLRMYDNDDTPFMSLRSCHGAGIYENGFGGSAGLSGLNTVGVYMNKSNDVDVVENTFYAPPQPPGVTEHYTFHACIEMEGENRNARVHCNTFQQPFYGIKLTDAIVDDFGNSSVGANNVFMQNVQWTMVPIQHAIYGNLQSGSSNYYADNALATIVNGFFVGTRPDQFGDDQVAGSFSVTLFSNIDGCEPDPLPIDELNKYTHISNTLRDVSLYPNPSENNTEIKIEVHEKSYARVFDLHGKEILSWELNESLNTKLVDLPAGVYLVTISSKTKNKTIKWIVQ